MKAASFALALFALATTPAHADDTVPAARWQIDCSGQFVRSLSGSLAFTSSVVGSLYLNVENDQGKIWDDRISVAGEALYSPEGDVRQINLKVHSPDQVASDIQTLIVRPKSAESRYGFGHIVTRVDPNVMDLSCAFKPLP